MLRLVMSLIVVVAVSFGFAMDAFAPAGVAIDMSAGYRDGYVTDIVIVRGGIEVAHFADVAPYCPDDISDPACQAFLAQFPDCVVVVR